MPITRSKLTRVCCHAVALLLFWPALVQADGGTLRFSRIADRYRVTLFTAPATLRLGPVDLSVLVQAAEGDAVLLDVPVQIHVFPKGHRKHRLGGPATSASATNKLFRAIQIDFPEAGLWIVEVEVGSARVETELDIGPPMPPWLEFAPWLGWPVVAIVVFGIHQWLTRRSRKSG